MKEQTPNREDGPEKKREKTNEEQTNEGGEVSTCGFIPFSSRPSLSITYNLKRLFIRCVFEREAIIFSIQREGEEESIKWGARTRKDASQFQVGRSSQSAGKNKAFLA